MYECFHCGQVAVIWMGDFTFEDCDMEGGGLIHVLQCQSCGAVITYEIQDG